MRKYLSSFREMTGGDLRVRRPPHPGDRVQGKEEDSGIGLREKEKAGRSALPSFVYR